MTVLKAKDTRRETAAKTRALDEVVKAPIKRLNVDLPARLHTQLKVRAAAEGTTIKALAARVLEAYLKE